MIIIKSQPVKKSEPIASILILEKEAFTGGVYIDPDTLKNGKSLSVKGRRLRIHQDGYGKWAIPPKWYEQGVTVYGNGRGPDGSAYCVYGCFIGKRKIHRNFPENDPDFIFINSLKRMQPELQLTS